MVLLILFLQIENTQAQASNQVLLKTCIDSAIANYPLIKQQALFAQQYEVQQQQLKKANLPQVNFNAKATYQNEVIGLNLNIPGMDIPELSKDQYKFSLDVQQSIYKGGATLKQKNIYSNQQEMAQQQLDIELYSLKKTVVELVFGVMFNRQQLEILASYQTQLDGRIEEFGNLVDNGVMLRSKLDAFVLEKLKVQQQIVEAQSDRVNLINNLVELTKLPLDTSMHFVSEDITINASQSQQRPEYKLMTLQQNQLNLSKELVGAKNLPHVFAYGTAGYGRPGFNYLSDDFDDFYLIGLGISWNIWNWNEGKREKQILDLNSQMIESQKQTFEKNLKLGLNTYQAEIFKQQKLIKQDEQIIEIQKQIASTSESQLKNGLVTVTQYVDELQKVQQQELQNQIHNLKLKLAKVNYLWAMGLL
jgi:outer membrane protein TolC